MDNSDHDVLSDKDMKKVVDLVAKLLVKGGMLSSFAQVSSSVDGFNCLVQRR